MMHPYRGTVFATHCLRTEGIVRSRMIAGVTKLRTRRIVKIFLVCRMALGADLHSGDGRLFDVHLSGGFSCTIPRSCPSTSRHPPAATGCAEIRRERTLMRG